MADVQIAVIDPEDTQLALAAPAEAVVNVAVPGIQGPIGTTGSVTIAQAGTAATPGIRFESDTNTGIYSPGADQLAISTGGTGQLFIDSSGNVGIGVQSPGAKVDLAAGTGAGVTAVLVRSAATNASGFQIVTDSTTDNVYLNNFYNAALRFGTNNTERLRIDSSGRVGIGTASPGEKLDISSGTSGTAAVVKIQDPAGRVVQIASPSSSTEAYIGTTTNHRLDFYTNNTVKATLDATGRLGIGTTTVDSLLHLAASAGAALRLEALTANLALDSVVGEIEFEANDASAQGTGIKAKLGAYSDVAAGNSVGLRFFAGAISENTGTERYRIAADGGHIFNGVGGSSTERARIDSSGRLLVGTSSDSGGALLQVNGNRIRIATANTPASATATGATGEICWDANYIYVCTATNTWRRTAISSW